MTAESKPKRVRTGCLTCRERHLKCDEATPDCNNCRKSNRQCKRGIKLNFLETNLLPVPTLSIDGLEIKFEDWSRIIADEYIGGESRYPPILTPPQEPALQFPVRPAPQLQTPRSYPHNILPPIQHPNYPDHSLTSGHDLNSRRPSRHSYAGSDSSYLTAPPTSFSSFSDSRAQSTNSSPPIVSSPEEAHLMNLYIEEVGLWMDSMNPLKHFSEILPHDALHQPMLYQALLACGARHLTLVNAGYPEEKALGYYNTATTLLLRALQNPERDTVCCATTAVCLNVYEIMSESPMQRMNHIAGARALIKECSWNARSTGIGAACFWLNVGMEILSCLHFNWQPAWDPDQWQVDMNLQPELEQGQEEFWVHRMLYIVGKISTFRALVPRFQRSSPEEERQRLNERVVEWQRLMDLCERWDLCKPKTMRELIRVPASLLTSPKSCFNQVNLTGRATHVGQLFYHTAMCLLAQINPLASKEDPEMNEMMMNHANEICSIVAHSQDRGIASVAIRSLAIAAECLTDRQEQEEVLQIFKKVRLHTGWRVEFISKQLKEKSWGWVDEQTQPHMGHSQTNSLPSLFNQGLQAPATSLPPPPPQPPSLPSGIVNPLLKTADFKNPNHPYQQYYQPPSQQNQYSQHYQ